jgi:hypothetical protein
VDLAGDEIGFAIYPELVYTSSSTKIQGLICQAVFSLQTAAIFSTKSLLAGI